MNNVERFMESVKVPNTAKVVKFVLKDVDANIENYSQMELEQFILDRQPNSPKTITTICYVLGLYAKWLQEQGLIDNDNLYQMAQSIDKKMLWKKAKPHAKRNLYQTNNLKKWFMKLGCMKTLMRCIMNHYLDVSMRVFIMTI